MEIALVKVYTERGKLLLGNPATWIPPNEAPPGWGEGSYDLPAPEADCHANLQGKKGGVDGTQYLRTPILLYKR